MSRLLRALDLLGVAVFAASGTLAALQARLDLLGVVVVAAVTAIGGGTLRDVLLARPVFWLADRAQLATILLAVAATLAWTHAARTPMAALLVADALGLAVFALSGARVALAAGTPALVVVFMGTLTGAGGGVLRDLLTGRVPQVLRQDIYASAAIAGIALYLLLRRLGVPEHGAIVAGAVAVFAIRLVALRLGWQLPALGPPMAG